LQPGRIPGANGVRSEFLFLFLALGRGLFMSRGWVRSRRGGCGRVLFRRTCRRGLSRTRNRMLDRLLCRMYGNRFAGRGRMRFRRGGRGRMLFRRMRRCGLDRMRDRMLGRLARRAQGRYRPGRGRMRSNALCGRWCRAAGRLRGDDARTSELRRMRCCGDRRMPIVA
jgi:hypothetical protein